MGSDAKDLAARFREVVARAPDRVGVCTDCKDWTFAELDQASDRIAAALAGAGVSGGDRVGLLCGNGVDFVLVYLGLLKAGATLVPLNLLLNPREMTFILKDSEALGLIYQEAFEAVATDALAGLGPDRLSVCIGREEQGGELGRNLSRMMRDESRPAPRPHIDPETAIAAILYTSGTTGHPKGAMLSHANLLANCAGVAEALALDEQDRLLVVLPMFHAFAATVGVLTPMLWGLGVVPVERFDPKLIAQRIARHGATVFLGVPSLYGALMRLEEEQVAMWRGVRVCVSGGAALPVALMNAFQERFRIPILEGDGPTECGPVTCVNPLHGERKPGSVGLPLSSVEIAIMDQAGVRLETGVYGEVCVRGPSVMKGYHGQPDATREAFFGEWFRTGDLGYLDPDGYLYLVDRIKDLIITNGMNVYPRVIEEILHAHPQVAEAAVVGDPDARHGELPVAYVVLRQGALIGSSELRAWCRDHLGRHEVPRRFRFTDALPRNAAGKVLKRELRRVGEYERGVHATPDAG